MPNLKFSPDILEKLNTKHKVNVHEVEECFLNRTKDLLFDMRAEHATNPPTRWFIAETDHGRLLKIIFIIQENNIYEVKSAYEPNKTEVKIYDTYA